MQTAKRGEEMRKIKLCLNDRWRSNYTKQPIQAFEKKILNKMMATLNKIEISQLWTFFFFFLVWVFSSPHSRLRTDSSDTGLACLQLVWVLKLKGSWWLGFVFFVFFACVFSPRESGLGRCLSWMFRRVNPAHRWAQC